MLLSVGNQSLCCYYFDGSIPVWFQCNNGRRWTERDWIGIVQIFSIPVTFPQLARVPSPVCVPSPIQNDLGSGDLGSGIINVTPGPGVSFFFTIFRNCVWISNTHANECMQALWQWNEIDLATPERGSPSLPTEPWLVDDLRLRFGYADRCTYENGHGSIGGLVGKLLEGFHLTHLGCKQVWTVRASITTLGVL